MGICYKILATLVYSKFFIIKCLGRDFPGDSVAKVSCSQCRGPGFNH